MSKWGKSYWQDLGERVGSTLLYGIITYITLNASTSIDPDQLWAVIALPTVLSLLKGLLMNLTPTVGPTASLVSVSSSRTARTKKQVI